MFIFQIPSDVRRQARRGLALAERWKRAVPTRNTQWATRLANGESVSAAELAEMLAYLQETANHTHGLAADGGPSARAIARLMAGGSDGKNWIERVVEANYGAKKGQTIKGRLVRGTGGRFASGGGAAPTIAASDLGLSDGELEAYTALQAGQALSIAQINTLTAAGLAMEGANGKVRLTAAGVRMRNKLARGDVAGAKAEAESSKQKAGGRKGKAGGGKQKATPEEKTATKRREMEAALKQLEFTPEETQALADFIDSGDLEFDSELGQKLVKAGLLTANKKEQEYVLTTPGRAFVRAIRQAKVVDAKQALRQGRLRMKLNGQRKINAVKKPTPPPTPPNAEGVQGGEELEIEATVDMGEYGVWVDVPDNAYVPYGVVSFAALEANKEASQAAEQISVFTYQFRELVRNAMGNPDVADKKKAVLDLIDEFEALVETTLADVGEAEDEGQKAESAEAAIEEGELAECQLSEGASGDVVELQESEPDHAPATPRDPVRLVVRMIKPGFGNPRDNHYYPKEVLERDAHVFVGVKGYTTNHRDDERSVRTEVSRVDKIIGFDDTGAPLAEVTVFDPNFAESIRNRKKANALDTLECSIMANGTARKGIVEGKTANVVEGITKGLYLDWVTKAGAGGQALRLAEAAPPTPPNAAGVQEGEGDGETVNKPDAAPIPEPHPASPAGAGEEKKEETPTPTEPVAPQEAETQDAPEQETYLSESEVAMLLEKVNPAVAKRVKGKQYATAEAVQAAVQDELAYLKEATGSGRPITFGEAQPVKRTPKEIEETAKRVSNKYLGGR